MTNPTAQSPPTPAVSSGVYYSHGNGSTQQEIWGWSSSIFQILLWKTMSGLIDFLPKKLELKSLSCLKMETSKLEHYC